MQRFNIKTAIGPLEYTIAHRPRVRKRLHMELDERGKLVVVVPGHWSKKQVHNILTQNVSRVERFLVNARKRQLEPLRYTHGELHMYLGRTYPLVIDSCRDQQTSVIFTGTDIRIGVGEKIKTDVRARLHAWYRKQACQVFTERLAKVSTRAAWVQDKTIPLKLRRMKRTWGNCSSSGVIKLNTHLIKAPLSAIDSVVAHELCHLQEMNHGRAFYALLEGLNPDWKADRMKLISEGNTYLL
jgi:predicted metal-dependent hydrolase